MFSKLTVMLIIGIFSFTFLSDSARADNSGVLDSHGLVFYLDTPTQVVYGHRPLTVKVVVKNLSAIDQSFDSSVRIAGPAWGGAYGPVELTGGRIYNTVAINNSITTYWRGTIPAMSGFQLIIPVDSGLYTAQYVLARGAVTPTVGLSLNALSMINVTQGEGSAYGEFLLGTGESPEFHQGDFKWVRWNFFSPILTQFYFNPSTKLWGSSCGIEGLPQSYMSQSLRTYDWVTSNIHIPDNAPLGECQIWSQVNMTNYQGQQDPLLVLKRFTVLPHR